MKVRILPNLKVVPVLHDEGRSVVKSLMIFRGRESIKNLDLASSVTCI